MNLSKRGIALVVLLAGCSGELGAAPPAPGGKGDGSEAAVPGSTTNEMMPEGSTEVDNGDGTKTIIKPDGSMVTVDGDGMVISETPAPTGTDLGTPTQPSADGDPTTPDAVVPTVPDRAGAVECAPGTPKSSQIPRLTNRQYDNTVRDLINVEMGLAASTLQADSKGNMDARSWQSYQDAAAAVAQTIITNEVARAQVITCTTADAACASQVISEFGAKVFRRPLSETEVASYEAMFADTTITETGTFDEQLQVVLEAMFQSPHFLTIAELSVTPSDDVNGAQRYALNDFELASRLSYMLWDTKPDQTLIDAAVAGTLTQGTGLADQAARMLADDRAKGLVDRLHMDYMRMGQNTRWTGYTRDAEKYAAYSPTQIDAIAQETLNVAQSVITSGGTFADLMTTTTGYVNADTAPLYGLNSADYGTELTEVNLGAGRPGILTRAGFLAANSYGNRTSPIHRGAFIMKDVLCTPLGDPTPDAASTPLPNDPSLVTNRQKTDAQTSIGADCISCHQSMINPPGFALESFDAVGGVQETDNGAAIDTNADVVIGGQLVHVTGAAELMAAIGAAPAAQRCYTENWVQVAYNRVLSAEDTCTVNEIATKMADANYSVKSLISDLALVDSFRYRASLTTEVAQ